jgi:aminopeptidase N
MKLNLALFYLFFLCGSTFVYADKYPKNHTIDIIHYKFELSLSDLSDEIIGTASLRILFKTDDSKKIRLDLINKSDARKGKGMVIDSIYSHLDKIKYTHSNDEIFLFFDTPPKKDEKLDISIAYRGIPAGGLKIGPTKYGDRSFFNENWPNLARHWLPSIDHPYDKATSEFIVKAPSKYKVVSNGLLQEETHLDESYTLTHWKQSVPVSPWLFVLGVAEFAVQMVDEFEGKSIQTWVYPQDRVAGFLDFSYPTKEVLSFYSSYVGPFAYEKLANIQSPSVGGGMETSSAIFYGENLVTGKPDNKRLEDVVIHELAHQWFGNAVTESTWDDAWLSEGFATYFTLLYQEYAYGHQEYINRLKLAKRRIDHYTKTDSTFSIISDRTAESGIVTNMLTYQKGAWILHMLRHKIGHVAFKNGIQSYYKKYFNSTASTDDFLAAMEKSSRMDLKKFFKQWLYQPEPLKIKTSYVYDETLSELQLKVEQIQSSGILFEFPLEMEIYHPQMFGTTFHEFDIKKKVTILKIPMKMSPGGIKFDPRTILLAEFKE